LKGGALYRMSWVKTCDQYHWIYVRHTVCRRYWRVSYSHSLTFCYGFTTVAFTEFRIIELQDIRWWQRLGLDSLSEDSYQTDLDFRSYRCPDSSGPSQTPLDAFLDSVLPPEDRWTGPIDPHLIGRLNPYDSDSTTPESPDSESEFDDEELLILNTPEALHISGQ